MLNSTGWGYRATAARHRQVRKTRELSSAGMDQSFVARWTCLSITVTRSILKCNSTIQETARHHISKLEEIIPGFVGPSGKPEGFAVVLDIGLSGSWRTLMWICFAVFGKAYADLSPDSVRGVLHNLPSQMSIMETLYQHSASSNFQSA